MHLVLPSKLTIATRGSALALWQANYVKLLILERYPQIEIELLIVKTRGDQIIDLPLASLGGKGLFVKEIEEALLNNEADLAVHSMKDLPMDLPSGLVLGAIPTRGRPGDVYLSCNYATVLDLPKGANVGTSSLRRRAQILIVRPDLEVISLRGNVNTRLEKLRQGQYDAIILAAAGLDRLDLNAPYMQPLPIKTYLPAAGQGALGIEFKASRDDLKELLTFIEHEPTRQCVLAERAFLRELNGSCHAPIAAFAKIEQDELSSSATPSNVLNLRGFIALENAALHLYCNLKGSLGCPEELGVALAKEMREKGESMGLRV